MFWRICALALALAAYGCSSVPRPLILGQANYDGYELLQAHCDGNGVVEQNKKNRAFTVRCAGGRPMHNVGTDPQYIGCEPTMNAEGATVLLTCVAFQ